MTLTGRPETDQAGRDLVERVRHIEGVITVRDQVELRGHVAMTHRRDRTLATSGLARVEGEGAMHVRVPGPRRPRSAGTR